MQIATGSFQSRDSHGRRRGGGGDHNPSRRDTCTKRQDRKAYGPLSRVNQQFQIDVAV